MKRIFLQIMIFSLLLHQPASASAQDDAAARAAAIAERQEMEERYKQMSSDIQSLTTSQAMLQRKVTALESEIRSLHDEIARLQQNAGVKYAAQDDLQKLLKAVQEMDQKRVKDNHELRNAIETIGRNVSSMPAAPPPKPKPVVAPQPPAADTPAAPVKGFEHLVQKGETLLAIINAYNEKLKENGVKERITLDSVQKANPGLRPERMQVGQKILLPDPREK